MAPPASRNSGSGGGGGSGTGVSSGGWGDAPLARALFAYLSSGENQLSFLEGDLIALMGEWMMSGPRISRHGIIIRPDRNEISITATGIRICTITCNYGSTMLYNRIEIVIGKHVKYFWVFVGLWEISKYSWVNRENFEGSLYLYVCGYRVTRVKIFEEMELEGLFFILFAY